MLPVPVDPLHEVAPVAEFHDDKQLSRCTLRLTASVDGVKDLHHMGIVELGLNLYLWKKRLH